MAPVLTVKGQPINQTQQAAAEQALAVGVGLQAPPLALHACIFDAIFESGLGTNLGPNSSGYGGLLGGATSTFGDVTKSLHAQATSFFKGGNGFQGGGAIALAQKSTDVAYIGSQVTAAVPFNAQGYSTQYLSQNFPFASAIAEATAIVGAYGAGSIRGGVAGLGGTGTAVNDLSKSAFTIGDTANPTEDYWTGVNRLAQDRYWYLFSDGETLYLADGPDLMAQDPAITVDRVADKSRIVHLDFTWDNTAFAFAVSHKKRQRVQRKAQLAKVTSPVQATLDVICDIDEIRAGDVIALANCGPGDGKWLLGNTRRSIFSIYTEATLVPALSPLTEQQVAGASLQAPSGAASSKPGAGTVIAAMLSAATTINNQDLPYVYGGGHAQVGTPDIGIAGGHGYDGHTVGYDCSGSVAAVLRAGGLWKQSSAPASNSIVDQLLSAGVVASGPGQGTPECTLLDTPSHIFMRLNGQFFGTEDGAGHLPGTSKQGAGWIPHGQPGSGFRTTHVPPTVLTKVTA